MKSFFIGKLSYDDSSLQASRVLSVTNIKDTIEAALMFSSFSISEISLTYARVAEHYFPACRKLGYTTGFFKEHTLLTYFNLVLNQSNFPIFDGIYIPFSGEIYLLPYHVCEFADIPEQEFCDAEFFPQNSQTESNVRFFRRFKVEVDGNKTSFTGNLRQKLLGVNSRTINVKTIASMSAVSDIVVTTTENGDEEKVEHEPMFFLYNGME